MHARLALRRWCVPPPPARRASGRWPRGGLGRLENPTYASALTPLLSSPSPLVRAAAAGAFAQMKVPRDWTPQLATERDALVRAAIYEAAGRGAPVAPTAEALLAAGLRDADVRSRTGAARGLESLVRLNRRAVTLAPATITALHTAFAGNTAEEFRELVLLTLNASRDQDAATLTAGLADPSPLVRRLAVIGSKTFVRDTSALVRIDAYRFQADCSVLASALDDPDDHVAINAGAYMLERSCPSAPLVAVATSGRNWRRRGNALLTISLHDTTAARPLVPMLSRDPGLAGACLRRHCRALHPRQRDIAVAGAGQQPERGRRCRLDGGRRGTRDPQRPRRPDSRRRRPAHHGTRPASATAAHRRRVQPADGRGEHDAARPARGTAQLDRYGARHVHQRTAP